MIWRANRLIVLACAATLAAFAWAIPASAQDTGIIPTRVIYPGETIAADALDQAKIRKGNKNVALIVLTIDQVEGKIAKRTLLPGRFIPVNALRDAYLVQQGASVEIVFVHGALTISTTGVTLQPGLAGDLVKVRNLDSGKVLSGTVMADGSIRVGAT